MYVEDEWFYLTLHEEHLFLWQLSEQAENRIRQEHSSWTAESLRSNLLESTYLLGKSIGDNILVALSGGVDSQVACLALKQAGIPFTAAILVFNDELNKADVNSATNFCSVNDIKYLTVDVDIMNFLGRDLPTYVDRYQCPSPQISSHLWFYEQLIKNYSPSSIVCGGNTLYMVDNRWQYSSTRAQSSWMTFRDVNNFNLVGNFKGYSFDIAVPFMLAHKNTITGEVNEDDRRCPLNYASKVQSMYNLGFNVIPQARKMTGFEEIKIMLKNQVKSTSVFDRWYRKPYQKKYRDYRSDIKLSLDIEEILTNAANNLSFSNTCINTYNNVDINSA